MANENEGRLGVLGGQQLGRRSEGLLGLALPLLVEGVELTGGLDCLALVLGQEEAKAQVGVRQATGGVEARAQGVGDGLAVHTLGPQSCHRDEGTQARPLRPGDGCQALLHQIAVLPHQRGHVGHCADGHQVEEALRLPGAPQGLVEGSHCLVGHSHRCQVPKGAFLTRFRQKLGVDEGHGRRQLWRDGVMIEDDDIHAQAAGVLHLAD